MKRKISAVLAADIAGYSRLVSEHDEETLQRLAGYRSAFEDLVKQKGGSLFSAAGGSIVTAGDAMFAEFPSALDALRCAVDVQESVRTRNLTYPRNRHMLFRMGISIGEVTEREDGLFGEGVDMAAQLEKLAKPGGICLTRSVHEQVANKQSLPFTDDGPRRLKNIESPVHVYSVGTSPDTQSRQPAVSRTMMVGATVLGAVAMVIAAAVIVKQNAAGPGSAPQAEATPPARTVSSAQTPIISEPNRPATPAPDIDADIAFWNGVRDSGDSNRLQSYLDRFPAGQFADLARHRIAELRALRLRPPNPPKLPINAPVRPDATDIAAVTPPPAALATPIPPSAGGPSTAPVPPSGGLPPVAMVPPAIPPPPPASPPSTIAVPPTTAGPSTGSGAASPADKSELAKSLQRELKRVGCLDGNADGVWGQDSRTAMKQFVKLAKLAVDGDEPNVAVLDAATAARSRVCPLVCDDNEHIVNGRCVEKEKARKVKAPAPAREVQQREAPRARQRAERNYEQPSRPSSGQKLCFGAERNQLVPC